MPVDGPDVLTPQEVGCLLFQGPDPDFRDLASQFPSLLTLLVTLTCDPVPLAGPVLSLPHVAKSRGVLRKPPVLWSVLSNGHTGLGAPTSFTGCRGPYMMLIYLMVVLPWWVCESGELSENREVPF